MTDPKRGAPPPSWPPFDPPLSGGTSTGTPPRGSTTLLGGVHRPGSDPFGGSSHTAGASPPARFSSLPGPGPLPLPPIPRTPGAKSAGVPRTQPGDPDDEDFGQPTVQKPFHGQGDGRQGLFQPPPGSDPDEIKPTRVHGVHSGLTNAGNEPPPNTAQFDLVNPRSAHSLGLSGRQWAFSAILGLVLGTVFGLVTVQPPLRPDHLAVWLLWVTYLTGVAQFACRFGNRWAERGQIAMGSTVPSQWNNTTVSLVGFAGSLAGIAVGLIGFGLIPDTVPAKGALSFLCAVVGAGVSGGLLLLGVVFLRFAAIGWANRKAAVEAAAAEKQAYFALSEEEKKKKDDEKRARLWFLSAQVVVTACSLVVACIVVWAMWPDSEDAGMMMKGGALVIGLLLGAGFLLIEGRIFTSCYHRKFRAPVLAVLLILGAAYASISAFISFAKVYKNRAEQLILKESIMQMSSEATTFTSAVESTVLAYAQNAKTPAERAHYTEGLQKLRDGHKHISAAKSRRALEEGVKLFNEGMGATGNALGLTDKPLAETVRLTPEPSASELGAQVVFGSKVEGVKQVYTGAVYEAAVVTLVMDYFVVIISAVAWLFAAAGDWLRKNAKPEDPPPAAPRSLFDPPPAP